MPKQEYTQPEIGDMYIKEPYLIGSIFGTLDGKPASGGPTYTKDIEKAYKKLQSWVFGEGGGVDYSRLTNDQKAKFKELMGPMDSELELGKAFRTNFDGVFGLDEKAKKTESDPVIKTINERILDLIKERKKAVAKEVGRPRHEAREYAMKIIGEHIDKVATDTTKTINFSEILNAIKQDKTVDQTKFNDGIQEKTTSSYKALRGKTESGFAIMQKKIEKYAAIEPASEAPKRKMTK